MAVKRGKETFSGFNKPKRTPSHPTKSHAVLAKQAAQTCKPKKNAKKEKEKG